MYNHKNHLNYLVIFPYLHLYFFYLVNISILAFIFFLGAYCLEVGILNFCYMSDLDLVFNLSQVDDGLFVSGYHGVKDNDRHFEENSPMWYINELLASNIRMVISLSRYPKSDQMKRLYNHYRIHHIEWPMDDSETQNIDNMFKTLYPIMAHKLLRHGNILVHCDAGISRSVTLVICFMMRQAKGKRTLREVFNQVVKIRPISMPNYGFQAQMMAMQWTRRSYQRTRAYINGLIDRQPFK